MIGASPGYVGYDEGGALTESVRRRPYQVVLFDEVEKAHADVFNVLLQVLDDGRLTDGQGRKVDFTTLLVMTSNLGSEFLADQAASDASVSVEAVRPLVMDAVRKHFRPEFLNRIDEIVLFSRLGREQMDSIVTIQLARLEKLLADRRMTLDIDDGALHWLAERGYDPVYGARPLKRVIQKELVDPVAASSWPATWRTAASSRCAMAATSWRSGGWRYTGADLSPASSFAAERCLASQRTRSRPGRGSGSGPADRCQAEQCSRLPRDTFAADPGGHRSLPRRGRLGRAPAA